MQPKVVKESFSNRSAAEKGAQFPLTEPIVSKESLIRFEEQDSSLTSYH